MVSFVTLFGKIPSLCGWLVFPIVAFFWVIVQTFLTFYQIARLKYCFSTKNSKQYGYSDKLFKFLYIFGVIVIICGVYIQFGNYTIYTSSKNGHFGCLYSLQNFIWVLIYSALYYTWDWLVLSLYV